MTPEDTCLGRRPSAVSVLLHSLILSEVNAIEHSWIVAFPPLALAIGESKVAVVGYSSLVATLVTAKSGLPPPPCIFMMEGHSIAHVILVARIHPLAQQVTLRTDIHRVPRLVTRVPKVVVVVMNTLYHKEACSCFLIKGSEAIRVKLCGIPCAQHVLVSHLRWMSVTLEVVFVGMVLLLV